MLIEQKYQIIQVVRCAGKSILRRECKLEFSFKSHYSKCQRLCKNLWWISINYHQSIAFSYSSANQDFPNELTVKAARIYYISSEIIYRYNSTRWPVPDETNILEVWTENGKYICFLMTNIFVLKWQIYLFDFWQILFVEAGGEELLLQNIIQEGSCIVVVVVVVYKRLFLRYLQSFKFRYYCRWTFGYRLYVFSVAFFVYRLSIENCMMRMRMPQKTFQVPILGALALYVFWIIITGWRWYTFKHIKAFPNMCDVSLLLYNLSLMLLQYSNFCNNCSKSTDSTNFLLWQRIDFTPRKVFRVHGLKNKAPEGKFALLHQSRSVLSDTFRHF